MPELPFDEDEDRVQWIEPDPRGFTIRTRYKKTAEVLDVNALKRAESPKTFRQDGVNYHQVASVPAEVYEQLMIKLGRHPTAEELIKLSQDRDYSKLRTREVKL